MTIKEIGYEEKDMSKELTKRVEELEKQMEDLKKEQKGEKKPRRKIQVAMGTELVDIELPEDW